MLMSKNKQNGLLIKMAAVCLIVMLIATAPAYALKDLSKPLIRPIDLEYIGLNSWSEWREYTGGEYNDWVGLYYAQGTGLELKISCQRLRGTDGFTTDENGNPYILAELNDYGSGKTLFSGDIYQIDDDHYCTKDSGITLTRTAKDQITLDFSADQIAEWNADYVYLYMSLTSAEFTDVETLEAHPAEARWAGTFLDDSNEVSSSTSVLYAFKQLYGTTDYFCYITTLQYGDETGSMFYFYTEKGDKLVHAYEPGVVSSQVTYGCFAWADEDSICRPVSVIAEDRIEEPLDMGSLEGIYKKIANYPQWEDDYDGYMY